MAYNALNNLIDAYIYANGVQAITGQILNGVLKQMVSQLGSGYHLMGVAVPATEPAANDYAMAYFAATAGGYNDFGGITLAAGEVAVLLTSGNGSWSKQTIYNVPTGTADLENTANFITNAVTDLVNYYTKTEIDGQKAETDAALADRYTKSETDTKLEDYYNKTETYDKDEVDSIVATLSRQEYIVAWDGLAAPDASAIPAGVTVTYSGTTYTGTLAASASTVNKIYMVWNGTAYDMYGTSQDGGYSWVPMGTTTVDLSQYATKEELEQATNPDITESSIFNRCISELFINGFTPGMKFYIFTYTNGLLTIVIKDSNDNLYSFANDKPVSANVPIYLNKSGIDLYIILSGVTQTSFPSNTIINDCVTDLTFSPIILSYIIKQNEYNIHDLDGIKGTYPICVSRFNRGALPNADHNACWVAISRRFTNAKDSVVSFANKTNANITNKFFDLYSIGTIDRGNEAVAPVNDYTDPSTFWVLSTSDAIFMPMIVGAVHNIDGDNTTQKWFTGGAHAYGNEIDGVSQTIRELSCDVLVDGKNVPIGTIGVRGNSCDIYVVENIQGWNTCKQDGTGREIIQRKTHIKVGNCKIAINVEIRALEDVVIDGPLYVTGIGTNNADGFRFIGSHSKMGVYTGEAIPANDDNEINAFRYIKSSFIFDCLYNLGYGVKNKYVTSVANLFASDVGKAYFRAVQQGISIELMQNNSIFYCTEISLSENK